MKEMFEEPSVEVISFEGQEVVANCDPDLDGKIPNDVVLIPGDNISNLEGPGDLCIDY